MTDALYVGLQDGDKILSFGIDAGAGKLAPRAETLAAGAPSVSRSLKRRGSSMTLYSGTRHGTNVSQKSHCVVRTPAPSAIV